MSVLVVGIPIIAHRKMFLRSFCEKTCLFLRAHSGYNAWNRNEMRWATVGASKQANERATTNKWTNEWVSEWATEREYTRLYECALCMCMADYKNIKKISWVLFTLERAVWRECIQLRAPAHTQSQSFCAYYEPIFVVVHSDIALNAHS